MFGAEKDRPFREMNYFRQSVSTKKPGKHLSRSLARQLIVKRCLVSTVIVLSLLWVAFLFFDLIPLLIDVRRHEVLYEEAIRNLRKTQRTAARYESFRHETHKISRQFDIADKALPERLDMIPLLTELFTLAEACDVQLYIREIDIEQPKGFFAEIAIAAEISGQYANITCFFHKISRLERILNVKEFSLRRSEKDETIQGIATFITYRYLNKIHKDSRTLKHRETNDGAKHSANLIYHISIIGVLIHRLITWYERFSSLKRR